MNNKYRFELNLNVHSEDSTMIVLNITARWTHGIYGTDEEATFTLIATAGGTDTIIDKNGNHREFMIDEDNDFDRAMNDWLNEEVV